MTTQTEPEHRQERSARAVSPAFVLKATEAVRKATVRRYRQFDPADIEDAVATAQLNLLDYWCPRHGSDPADIAKAVHFGKKRASEYLLDALDRRAMESPLFEGDDVADSDHPDAPWPMNCRYVPGPREDY